MSFAYFSPKWFFGYDVVLEIVFALVTLLLALFAFRIYEVSKERQIKHFTIAFALISISYFVKSIFNFLIIYDISAALSNTIFAVPLNIVESFGNYAHAFFMTTGLLVLVYMTLRIKSWRTFALMAILSFFYLFTGQTSFHFFLLSTVYFGFILWYYVRNYLKKKSKVTLVVSIAFLFLLLGNVEFVLVTRLQPIFHVIGHFFELFGYLFILWSFYLLRRK